MHGGGVDQQRTGERLEQQARAGRRLGAVVFSDASPADRPPVFVSVMTFRLDLLVPSRMLELDVEFVGPTSGVVDLFLSGEDARVVLHRATIGVGSNGHLHLSARATAALGHRWSSPIELAVVVRADAPASQRRSALRAVDSSMPPGW